MDGWHIVGSGLLSGPRPMIQEKDLTKNGGVRECQVQAGCSGE